MPRFLYVTAQDRRDLYERLTAEFSGQNDVEVILDRRRMDRRQAGGTHAEERRRADRRRHPDLDLELRSAGSFIASLDDRRVWV